MKMKGLFFSVLLATAAIPAANAYESPSTRLSVESFSELTAGMSREAVHMKVGKPVMRTAGIKDTWIYKAIANTSHGVDVCNVSVAFDKNNFLERAFWDEKSCDNSTLSQLAPKNAAPVPVYDKNNYNYPAYDGMLSPKPPRTLAILDYNFPAPIPQEQPKPPVAEFTLSSDVLFAFDSFKLKPTANAELARRYIEAKEISDKFNIIVLGHTDRIGKANYNKTLSEKRAMAVGLFYMNEFNVDPSQIYVEGLGSSEPVTQCGDMPRKQLIDCLQPDRRVQITFQD